MPLTISNLRKCCNYKKRQEKPENITSIQKSTFKLDPRLEHAKEQLIVLYLPTSIYPHLYWSV